MTNGQANSATPAGMAIYLMDFTNGSAVSIHGTNVFYNSANAIVYGGLIVGGNTATTVNAIKFAYSSGNIAQGVFTLYGLLE
jgi:hypothetical protein